MDVRDEHFRLLVESSQEYAIYLLDPDGVIQSWNPGIQRLKGYTAPEVIGKSFSMFFTDSDRAANRPGLLLAAALAAGRVEDIGWRRRKDGRLFWASAVITTLRDEHGRHVGFGKVTRDLTDRSYRAFLETSHAIVWTADPSGRPGGDSTSWRNFTGQSEADWIELRAWDAVHPDDRPGLDRAWATARANVEVCETEFRLRRRDGVYVWMSARIVPLRAPDGRVREWFGVLLDIDAAKHAELERERAVRLWQTTLHSIGDGVISTDAHSRVMFVNRVAEELIGWRADDAVGRPLAEVFPIFNEETGLPVENPVDKALRLDAVVGLANHTMLRAKDGVERPIDDSAAPIRDPDGGIHGVVLVFRDATEIKREVLRRTFLARASDELIAAADYRDALARIAQFAVPRLADWAGIDIAEPGTGRPQQLAVAHVDPAKVELARAFAARNTPDPDAEGSVWHVMRTGRAKLWAELPRAQMEAAAKDAEHLRLMRELDLRSAMIVPLRGKAGVFGAMSFVYSGEARRYTEDDLAFAEEVARRAAMLIERRRAEEEAEAANRTKDEFLATLSHELRTPLQAILGYATMLDRGIARDPRNAIAAIVRNATAQTRLVEDMLDVSRIASGKLRLVIEAVDVVAAMRAALDAIRPAAAARDVQLVEDLPGDLPPIAGDFDRLQQITWNLLSNAVKFTPAGGRVELRAERDGAVVRLVVADTGKGIPREHLGAIFERFRQVDSSTTRQHGGLGLGLAIVRYLVEAHGGTVEADSAGPGQGATLTVTLPARIAALAPAAERSSSQRAERPLRGTRVLVVEDDLDARALLSDALAQAGARVAVAASAREGVAALVDEPPHVVVSDIAMPGEDGYAMLRRIRELPPEQGGDVPAIALTAYAREEDVRRAEQAGFQLHIVKPVRIEALIEAVRSCVKP